MLGEKSLGGRQKEGGDLWLWGAEAAWRGKMWGREIVRVRLQRGVGTMRGGLRGEER